MTVVLGMYDGRYLYLCHMLYQLFLKIIAYSTSDIFGTTYAHYISILGVGKERRVLIGSWWPAKAAPLTGTTLSTAGLVPAESRQ